MGALRCQMSEKVRVPLSPLAKVEQNKLSR